MRKTVPFHTANIRGKANIQQDQIRCLASYGGHGFRPVQRGHDLVTGSLQFQGNGLEDDFIVIHDQNSFRFCGFGAHIKFNNDIYQPESVTR